MSHFHVGAVVYVTAIAPPCGTVTSDCAPSDVAPRDVAAPGAAPPGATVTSATLPPVMLTIERKVILNDGIRCGHSLHEESIDKAARCCHRTDALSNYLDCKSDGSEGRMSGESPRQLLRVLELGILARGGRIEHHGRCDASSSQFINTLINHAHRHDIACSGLDGRSRIQLKR